MRETWRSFFLFFVFVSTHDGEHEKDTKKFSEIATYFHRPYKDVLELDFPKKSTELSSDKFEKRIKSLPPFKGASFKDNPHLNTKDPICSEGFPIFFSPFLFFKISFY